MEWYALRISGSETSIRHTLHIESHQRYYTIYYIYTYTRKLYVLYIISHKHLPD